MYSNYHAYGIAVAVEELQSIDFFVALGQAGAHIVGAIQEGLALRGTLLGELIPPRLGGPQATGVLLVVADDHIGLVLHVVAEAVVDQGRLIAGLGGGHHGAHCKLLAGQHGDQIGGMGGHQGGETTGGQKQAQGDSELHFVNIFLRPY